MITVLNLNEVCDIQSGGTPSRSKKEFWNGDIPWSKISDIEKSDGMLIETEESITAEGLKAIRNRIFNPGTLLFAMYGSVGKTAIAGIEVSTNQAILGITVKDEKKLDMSYLQHWLGSQQSNFDKDARGVAQKNLSAGYVRDLKIPLPPLKEQKRIAAILDKADAIRRKRQQAIDLADQLLRSVFLDMFGDPVTNPKGWKLVSFGSVGQLDRGKSKHRPRNDPILLGGSHPLIQTGDVANSGGYITTYKSTYSDVGLKQSKKWSKGTLCITIAANIANTGVLEFDACFPDSVVGFTPNTLVTVEYVQTWLGFLQKIIEDAAPESAQKNINLAILRGLEIPLPTIKMQTNFSQIVQHVKKTKSNLVNSGKETESLLDSLTQQAFRGELIKQAKAA